MYKVITKDYDNYNIKFFKIDNEVWVAANNLYNILDIIPSTKPINFGNTTQIILKSNNTDGILNIVNDEGLSELLAKADNIKAKDFEYWYKYVVLPVLV